MQTWLLQSHTSHNETCHDVVGEKYGLTKNEEINFTYRWWTIKVSLYLYVVEECFAEELCW